MSISARAIRLAAALLCLVPLIASAQGKQAWEEYDRLLDSRRNVAALSADDMFGESLDLYSGGLSFSATDVSIPGNNALPVAVTRKFTLTNRYAYGTADVGSFGDWELDIPHLSGVFAPNWHDNRCDTAVPPAAAGGLIPADEFWAGNQAEMPGGGEMLQVTSTWPKPTAGGPYKWVTAGNTYFSCLSSIKNGTGQGFLAIDSSGTKYWFDHMARTTEPEYTYKSVQYVATADGDIVSYTTSRAKVSLYVTRVEDRFGNSVEYTYDNTATQALKITQIAASDGRTITLQYNPSGFVSSVSDGSRTWSYGYQNGSLTSVTLPDTQQWAISLAGLANAQVVPSTGESRTCASDPIINETETFTGSITHPSGATATYTVGPVRFGRTKVPGVCRNYQLPGNPDPSGQSDDYFVVPVRAWALTLKSRQIAGAGLTAGTWTYAWSGGAGSWQVPPGETYPICSDTNCLDPVCLSDECAGSRTVTITGPDGDWQRYSYGNTYRYNEGKLLAHEQGSGPADILKSTVNTYNYATSGQPYAATIGTSPQRRGAGFTSEYPRPLIKTETLQDGGLFVWEVAKGCPTAGVYCLDTFARPTKVIKTGTVAGVMMGATLVIPPTQTPTLSTPATNNTGSYTVNWTSASEATSYELQERLGTGAWGTIQNTSAISRAISGKAEGSWSYQVRGCNSAGCTAWSTTQTTSVTLPPAGAPTLTTPASNTTGSYTVSWTSVSAATRYDLQERLGTGAWIQIQDSSATSRAITGKTAGNWGYQVRACNGAGCGPWSTIQTTAVTLPPTTVPTLTVPATNNTGSYTVSWTSVSAAAWYELQERLETGPWDLIHDTSPISKAVSGKTTGNWGYQVRACNGGGCTAWSASKTTSVTLPPAGVPTLTTPASNFTGSYTVSWTSVSLATWYELQERLGTGAWVQIQNTSATSRAITGKTAGNWGYQVRACNDAGCGGWSTIETTSVTLPPTTVPTLTVPATNNTGSYTVSWTSVSVATRYELQERLGTGSWIQIQNNSAISKAISGKTTGSWGYQVRACNDAGCAAWSTTKTTAVTLPPTTVPTLTAPASSTTGSYTVSWTAVSAATRYELEQRKDGGAWSNVYNAASTSKAVSVQVNGAYGYQVRACNDGGCTAWSAVTTTVVTLPLGVPTLTVSPSTAPQGDTLTASWTSVAGATQYVLERNRNGGSFSAIYTGASTSSSFTTGLTGTWKYRVKACDSGNCGAYSTEQTVIVETSTNLVAPVDEGGGS